MTENETFQPTSSSEGTKPVALVTGANTGIGFQVAKGLAEHGFTVLIGARDLAKGTAAAEEIGAEAHAVQLDVTDGETIAAAAQHVRDEFGRLDVLVNNAGVSFVGDPSMSLEQRGAAGRMTTVDLDDVRRMFETNVFGMIAVTQAMLPLLEAGPAGRIVNVGSGGGSMTANADPANDHRALFGNYSVSKAAGHAVSLALAIALEPTRVKVNTADPGFTSTALNGFRGTKSVEEGAHRIIELALIADDGPNGTFSNDDGPVAY